MEKKTDQLSKPFSNPKPRFKIIILIHLGFYKNKTEKHEVFSIDNWNCDDFAGLWAT
jgi:hypothetical protein